MRAAERAWTPLAPRRRRARRTASTLTTLAGRLAPRLGPEPGAHVVHGHGRDDRCRGSPACGSRRCPIRRCREERPGPRRVRPLPRHRPPRRDRSPRRNRPATGGRELSRSRRSRWTTPRTRSSRRTCCRPDAARRAARAGRGRSTRCGTASARRVMRCSPRRRPFGFPGGTRITAPDRSPRRHHRPGHRPLPPVGHDRRAIRSSASELPARLRPVLAQQARERSRDAGRRSGRVLPLDRAVAQADARRARRPRARRSPTCRFPRRW